MLGSVFIGPLKLIFECIFRVALELVENPGIAIIVLSLAMNILVLPLYMRADAMQEEARDVENKLKKGVDHIKKSFSGDERMMILQTYYRQNNYKPTHALRGSVSLLLEIPFFMAAYQFLSNLEVLSRASFGPIKSLGSPDALITIGSVSINLLPILMTLVNVISSAIYLKGFPLKTKIQLYAMAGFFLVFLYTSPSGLVFYWTLNNVFSLVKTIFYKLKNPKKILCCLMAAAGVGSVLYDLFVVGTKNKRLFPVLLLLGAALVMPLVISFVKMKFVRKERKVATTPEPDRKMFVMGCCFLTALVGLLIPSNLIAASPQEFVDITFFHHPLWYVVSALCMSAGFFLVWMGVFYWLASKKGKVIFQRIVWTLCGVFVINYMFFGTNLGLLTSTLQYGNGVFFSQKEYVINTLVVILSASALYFVGTKFSKAAKGVLLTAVIVFAVMSGMNMIKINKSVKSIDFDDVSRIPHITLSRDGQNVVVIMLDRAGGEYLPYILNEKPELREVFDGFTYYKNTISFGGHTNIAVPALLGGYEYTPVEMNKRDDEALVEKHNEALKLMPVMFAESGYNVTVCDPPQANYSEIPDLSIYSGYDNISAYITKGKFGDDVQKAQAITYNNRNFFMFSLMKTMPLCVQPTMYNYGEYGRTYSAGEVNYTTQIIDNPSVAEGYRKTYMESYNVLTNMDEMTTLTEGEGDNFLFLSNEITHDYAILQAPDYKPADKVDNTAYDEAHKDRFVVDGKTLDVSTPDKMGSYHINVSALATLGEWLEYLKAEGVYDNTRIIIAADHGFAMGHSDDLVLDDSGETHKDMYFFYPLLLVKDFNATGFSVSEEFMTNADVPTLAVDGIIEDPRNPFTGKEINSSEKTAHDQYVSLSSKFRITENNGNTFLPSKWASVTSDLFDTSDWETLEEEIVLKEHSFN